MKKKELTAYLDELLAITKFSDSSLNGIQVDGPEEIGTVAYAVDGSLDAIEEAIQKKAQMLIVHHGLFWGTPQPISGYLYTRIRRLMEGKCSLYASHLPLDAHPIYGNNAVMAQKLGLEKIVPFGDYHGPLIGFGGDLTAPLRIEDLAKKVESITGKPVIKTVSAGSTNIKRVACVSGGASEITPQAAYQGFDAYVTGEQSHSYSHLAKECGISVIYGGHYATETLGVLALEAHLQDKFSLKSVIIDQPTEL